MAQPNARSLIATAKVKYTLLDDEGVRVEGEGITGVSTISPPPNNPKIEAEPNKATTFYFIYPKKVKKKGDLFSSVLKTDFKSRTKLQIGYKIASVNGTRCILDFFIYVEDVEKVPTMSKEIEFTAEARVLGDGNHCIYLTYEWEERTKPKGNIPGRIKARDRGYVNFLANGNVFGESQYLGASGLGPIIANMMAIPPLTPSAPGPGGSNSSMTPTPQGDTQNDSA